MTKAERARELFLEGCNCAQAVFLAFAEEKMDRDTALKIASVTKVPDVPPEPALAVVVMTSSY